MKKYCQLLLFILSISSIALFLVYRHEYNRLHYVLEVFNFFGQPCNITDLETSDNIANHYDWGVEPVWQDSESYYIYSAFWTANEEVGAIVLLGPRNKIATKCYLWFEEKETPVIGHFRYSIISNDLTNSQTGCFYYCKVKNVKHKPYAVSFSTKDRKFGDLKKTLLTVQVSHHQTLTTTLCISPTLFNKTLFVEFLSYHKLVGVENFIFYGNSIPFRLTKIVTNLSNRLGVKVTFFVWNFPLSEGVLTRSLVENDCLLRASNSSKNVITLELDEYIVPAKMDNLNQVLSNLETKEVLERVGLPVQTFCIKSINRHKPIALQNTEVSYNDENVVRYIYRNSVTSNGIATQVIVKGIASIHKYINCSQKVVRVYQDTSILKFSTDFIRSTLVQLNLHGQI